MNDLRTTAVSDASACWPALPLEAWKDTCDTLHMLTQIVGKVRLALTPKVNHWWNVTLHVSARGLTTGLIPCGERVFEMEFDFVEHKLAIRSSERQTRAIALKPRPVADFYREFTAALHDLGIDVSIWKMPVEVADAIPFDQDIVHHAYDPEYAHRFWRVLASVDEVFKVFRSRFIGKSSPAQFFWGSFDHAVTRFSGRKAPPRSETDPVLRRIMQEAYSHEVISAGWWPGGGEVKDAAFYCYAAPQPAGFEKQPVAPREAFYHPVLGEYVLMYDEVRKAKSPTATLLDFLESTYRAGAITGNWDRENLEREQQPAAGAA